MIRIVWTHQAIQDVQAIRAYIGRDSARYAALVTEQIVEAINRLTNFPTSGRIVPELQDETLREVILGNFRIVYRVTRDEVQVLTVFHAARQFGIPRQS